MGIRIPILSDAADYVNKKIESIPVVGDAYKYTTGGIQKVFDPGTYQDIYNSVTGHSDRRDATKAANAALDDAAAQYGLATGGLSYNVSPDMVQKYMSPDVAYRQQAATQGLGQIYGNSGALTSSAAQKSIAGANAQIAAQAWNDAFGRASGELDKGNALAVDLAKTRAGIQSGQAANNLALAMNKKSLLDSTKDFVGMGTDIAKTAALF
jgi:hypothetical protein